MFEISECNDYEKAKMLFTEYSKLKGAEQCFKTFASELENIESIYPKGQLLLGLVDDKAIGCIALKAIDEEKCELKRLYIKEEHRGNGYSKLMFETILARAKDLGFSIAEIRTLPEIMAVGYKMYLKYGFIEQEIKEAISNSKASKVHKYWILALLRTDFTPYLHRLNRRLS